MVISEHRVTRTSAYRDRVVWLERGAILAGGPVVAPLPRGPVRRGGGGRLHARPRRLLLRSRRAGALGRRTRATTGRAIVAVTGANGSGKSTLGKLVAPGWSGPTTAPDAASAGRRICPRIRAVTWPGSAVTTRSPWALVMEPPPPGRSRPWACRGYDARHPARPVERRPRAAALAAVLACEPDVVVLGGPTRGCRSAARARLAGLLRDEAGQRATLLITHDHELAVAVADRTAQLGEVAERAAA